MEQEKGIWIITEETTSSDGGKGGTDEGFNYGAANPAIDSKADHNNQDKNGHKRSRLSADDLKQNMEEFLDVIEEALEQAEKPKSGMVLDEVELSVEVNGKGQVSLFGTGGEAGGKGAIKFKFKRKDG